uniref:Uncharacterized protein n=1 Tax=Tanacetum cinerariifolium TaxID=118510 RepID=A0A699TJ59_TANCI|nr:hypothetical protein [Tanacetum cinerariifolium]
MVLTGCTLSLLLQLSKLPRSRVAVDAHRVGAGLRRRVEADALADVVASRAAGASHVVGAHFGVPAGVLRECQEVIALHEDAGRLQIAALG